MRTHVDKGDIVIENKVSPLKQYGQNYVWTRE